MRTPLLFLLLTILVVGCQSKKTADLLIYNATIYTVDSQFNKAAAMAILDGKILATGTQAELTSSYNFKDSLNAEGNFIYRDLLMHMLILRATPNRSPRSTFLIQIAGIAFYNG
ncbi:hypothetical protein [Niabella hibiscisoli]|uniref:hypothetical protein n=1 Tax=Niabella hibiscisoli TaxID=1825928 RepID=UPI001F10DD54|nr:hypothetical protein [Niabella hibiscisoli]MCH5715816.1 hypothetical protein [Niabella hibiscisoli]